MKLLEPGYVVTGGGGVIRAYDVSTDDQRFLMIKLPRNDVTARSPTLVVVQNWSEELKRLVPTR